MNTNNNPSSEDIQAQLEIVLSSDEFIASRRLQEFLRYIVEKTLQGDQNKIKQFTIAIDVYNRPDSFEPKSDPLIRIEARRLRRALTRFYENNPDENVLIYVPRGSYVPRFSWNKTPGIHESTKNSSQLTANSRPELSVVGVFPFEYTGDEEHVYLADGLAEELVDQLSQFPYLRMMSFSTTSNFRSLKSGLADVCSSLGIEIALTGSLKSEQGKIRFCCKLHDIGTGEHIWSYKQSVDRTITTLPDCEEEILAGVSSRIADTCGVLSRYLLTKLTIAKPRPSTFEAILKCHYYQQNTTPETFELARSALETAILNDPKNPTLLAFMSELYIDAFTFGFAEITDAVNKGSEFASLAVTLDPNSQIAHHSNAYAALVARDRNRVLQSAQRIVEINPHAASMIATAGFWFCLCGEYERGIKWFSTGTELNPMYERWLHAAPFFYFLHKDNYIAALNHARDFEMPGFFWGNIMRVSVLGLLGRIDEARVEYDKLLELKPDFSSNRQKYIESFVLDDKLVNRMLTGIDAVRNESMEKYVVLTTNI